MKSKKIFLLHNIIAPYRLPLFQDLSKEMDLTVYFCTSKSKDRLWNPSLENYSFKRKIGKNISLRIGNNHMVINYLLPLKLLLEKYDIYIAGDNAENIPSILITCLISRFFKKPFILWSGAIETEYLGSANNKRRLREIFIKPYRKIVYRYASCVIAYGEGAKLFLVTNGVSEDKIFIGTQVIFQDQTKQVSISKEDMGLQGKKVVLCMSYLVKRKGINHLINAFKGLNRKDSVLVIAGAGREEEHLKFLSANEENIKFVGYVEKEEKSKYYTIADIFVLPSYHDPWALVINEAMFFGLPIITTKGVGSSMEFRDNSFVVTPGDEKALKIALEKLLDDEKLRKEMGRKSREYIKHYDANYALRTFKKAISYATRNVNTSNNGKSDRLITKKLLVNQRSTEE